MHLGAVLILLSTMAAAPLEFTVTPAAPGQQLVRSSLPFPSGALREDQGLIVSDASRDFRAALRVLTWHPKVASEKRSARRAIVSFPYEFSDRTPVRFRLKSVEATSAPEAAFPVEVKLDGGAIRITYRKGPTLTARLLGPGATGPAQPVTEVVESNAHFLWKRIRVADSQWPRVLEVRVDSLGGIVLVAHLQRNLPGDNYAHDFGWEIESTASSGHLQVGRERKRLEQSSVTHQFATGVLSEFFFDSERFRINHPAAPFKRRGQVELRTKEGGFVYRYLRCSVAEKVPMQQLTWHRAEVMIAPATLAPLTATLEYPHEEQVSWRLWDALYETREPLELRQKPELSNLLHYHHDAIAHSVAQGDDWGNVTGYNDGSSVGSPFGMNRLNHAPAIFEEAWRSGERRLRDVAVNWCDNFHDLSIWWGPSGHGGTRYNNIRAQNRTPLNNDNHFMWRSNDAVNFCTKGYSSFLLAYEQTGDPRMREALEAQIKYASEFVHCDRGEARNIGDVDDFMRLYEYTGERQHLAQGLRLYRELRTKLSAGELFSQGGQPIEPSPPFIDDDDTGYHHPFAKPYIIGYALLGLPKLARTVPDEPKLQLVIQAVADFLAESQDPAGGWRYPHPRSSGLLLNQAMEHAWQLVEADRWLGPQPKHLDAIERVLRQRFHGWQRTGHVTSGVFAWELATGKVRDQRAIAKLYRFPNDRDFLRDYTEGQITFGSSPPEGLVYFPGVLAFYLQHRPADRLLVPPKVDEPLGKLLAHSKR
jgi:hypothetical protein